MQPWMRRRLPRLAPEAYRAHAAVFWTMAVEARATGWLDALLHARLREALLHACVRQRVICPIYVLMPDHAHFLVLGMKSASDQRLWARMLRREWNLLLASANRTLQRQAYDHVLRETERERDAFQSVAWYIFENPVRAGLIANPVDWEFAGACVPGYPSLNPRQPNFWDSFWLTHAALLQNP